MTKKQKIAAKAREKKGKLTARMERFCQEYILDVNGSAAARRAGYKLHSAAQVAAENLRKPIIQQRITQLREENRDKGYDGMKERIVLEMRRIATADTRKLYDVGGNLLPPDQWDDETAAAVIGIETLEMPGLGVGFAKKVRSADKMKAAEILARLCGFNAPDKVAQTDSKGKDIAPPVVTLNVIQSPVPFAGNEKEIQ